MSAAPDSKLRQKQPTVGIAAGAEDAKYHAKYKELKRKVKDFETVCFIFLSLLRFPSYSSSRIMTNFTFKSSKQGSPSVE